MKRRFKRLLDNLRGENVPEMEDYVAHYRETVDEPDVDGLLTYLYQAGALTGSQVRRLYITEKPRLTSFENLLKVGRAPLSEGVRRRYVPLTQLGEGSMGKVYVSEEPGLNRKVAFKQISTQFSQSEELRRRFVSEVQVTAQLEHPNVVPVYGLEVTPEGSLGYAMRLVNGVTFEDVIERCAAGHGAQWPIKDRLDYFLRVCEGVAYAHSRGVVHRDLKPANIMVGEFFEVYVLDWGLSMFMDTESRVSVDLTAEATEEAEENSAIGTPAYMSPEQAMGRNDLVDGRTDQYALGLILQHLLTLVRPVPGDNHREVLENAARGVRAKIPRRVPAQLRAVIAKSCAPKQDDRYPDVETLARDIRAFLRDEPLKAYPDGILRRLLRRLDPWRDALVLILLVVVALGATAVISSLAVVQATWWTQAAREEALEHVLTEVAAEGDRVDAELIRYERLLESLAGAAVAALETGEVDPNYPVYFDTDFSDGNHPEDLSRSDFHKMKVSFSQPVVKFAPGVDRDAVLDDVHRLVQLRRFFARTMLRSHEDSQFWETQGIREQMEQEGTPVVWVTIGLEDGVHIAYPGHGEYAVAFDPRQRPWYRVSANKRGVFWGAPYIDASGLGLILPCSMALYDGTGRFRGVANLDFTFAFLVSTLLESELEVDTAWLLDERGAIVVNSDSELEPYEKKVLDNRELDLEPFPVEEIVTEIAEGSPGGVATDGERLYVYTQLTSLGWYYVVAGDRETLMP